MDSSDRGAVLSIPTDIPDMTRLRLGKLPVEGHASIGNSLTIAPEPRAIVSNRSACSGG